MVVRNYRDLLVDDCSGTKTPPPIWVNARLGEPAVIPNNYTNYLKADKDSLIVHELHGPFLEKIPFFPQIYNLYQRNSIISDNIRVEADWQNILRNINADLGAKKQVDIVVILTSESSPVYAQALEAKWVYGPKNALIIVIGVSQQRINWVRTVSISKVEELKTHLRTALEGTELNKETFRTIGKLVETEFERTPMAEFEYLAYSATPSVGFLIFLYLFGFLASAGLGYVMHRKDVV